MLPNSSWIEDMQRASSRPSVLVVHDVADMEEVVEVHNDLDTSTFLTRVFGGREAIEMRKPGFLEDTISARLLQSSRALTPSLGHLVGRPWIVLRMLQRTRFSISVSSFDRCHSSAPKSILERTRQLYR